MSSMSIFENEQTSEKGEFANTNLMASLYSISRKLRCNNLVNLRLKSSDEKNYQATNWIHINKNINISTWFLERVPTLVKWTKKAPLIRSTIFNIIIVQRFNNHTCMLTSHSTLYHQKKFTLALNPSYLNTVFKLSKQKGTLQKKY